MRRSAAHAENLQEARRNQVRPLVDRYTEPLRPENRRSTTPDAPEYVYVPGSA